VFAVPANFQLSRTLTRGGDTYIASGWLKNENVDVTLTVTLKNTGGTVVHTQPYTILQHAGYSYFEFRVPIPALPEFTINISGAFGSTSSVPYLDDIAFYPEHADLVSHTYYFPFGTSTSTHRDQTVLKKFGSHGKIKDIFDKDGNLVSHTDYFLPAVRSVAVLTAGYTNPDHVYYNKPAIFKATLNCMDDIVYEWDFGSGYLTGSQLQGHTFTSTGPKVVSLRVTHPYYGTKTFTRTITVELENPEDIE
jgi:hypothetical protein